MNQINFVLTIIAIGLCSIILVNHIDKKIQQTETRIIEAIEKQNDSINAVNFLNREK